MQTKEYEAALAEMRDKECPDLVRVHELLAASYERGDPNAAYALGTWSLHGFFLRRNLRRAVQLLREAAQLGVADAQYDLAVCYELGVGVKQNERLAFEYYLRAALSGDPGSNYEVGRCYYYGIGTEKNTRTAWIWIDAYEENRAPSERSAGADAPSRTPPTSFGEASSRSKPRWSPHGDGRSS